MYKSIQNLIHPTEEHAGLLTSGIIISLAKLEGLIPDFFLQRGNSSVW